jgi:hypothetical protein
MARRIIAIALLGSVFATSALAQIGGSPGGGSKAGGASGAPGSVSPGTAGVSPSTSTPQPGMPGTPGPASGAGVPGGSGPASTVVVPNIPALPQAQPTVQRDSGGATGVPAPTGTASGGSRPPAASGSRSASHQSGPSASHPSFNPEAVTDRGLEVAGNDIAAMSIDELRALMALLDACTVNNHPAERKGKCGAENRLYQAKYAKERERQIDRTLAELERVVRFQNMFRQPGPRSTEFEDRINARLRVAARTSLAEANTESAGQTRGAAPPYVTRDASMPR